MKNTILLVGVLLIGIGAGFLLASTDVLASRSGPRSDSQATETLRRERFEDLHRIETLEAEIERLKQIIAKLKAKEEFNPFPDDTPEEVAKLLEEAYADNNVDWLIEVIQRLLRMGEPGYPLLRRLIMDIVFKAKFLPSQSEFRPDHIYRFGRIFANQEKDVIGFLNFLLKDSGTLPIVRQVAMMGGAFYVGSKAPGTEELQQTMMQMFMESQGGDMAGMLPGNVGKKMQVVAMAMSGDPKMIGPLKAELKASKDKELQSDIIGALAYLGDPDAVPMIKERLDPATGDHRDMIRALGRVDSDESHRVATDFLKSIPDSKRFYRHAGTYVRSGGGASAVMLIRERVQANPSDPQVGTAVGTLRRYPTQESLETLNFIATSTPDKKIRENATKAAGEVDKRLRGEVPAAK